MFALEFFGARKSVNSYIRIRIITKFSFSKDTSEGLDELFAIANHICTYNFVVLIYRGSSFSFASFDHTPIIIKYKRAVPMALVGAGVPERRS